MPRLRNINDPGVRRVRALHELLELVDRWRYLEARSMEGAVFSMSKCETLGCPTQCHSSPFCPACLVEIEAAVKESELRSARPLVNERARREYAVRKARMKGKPR